MAFTLEIKKGVSFDLTKENDSLKKLTVGLGWDTRMDLDSIAFLLDENDRLIDTVCFHHKSAQGVRLNGDNVTGEGEGDDEKIFVSLDDVASRVKKIAFFANIYNAGGGLFSKGKTFKMVNGAYIRIVNDETDEELCRYSLKEDGDNFNAFHLGDLTRNGCEWEFKAIGEGANGSISELEKLYR